mgnify:CR=1 FL=1
MLKNMIAIKTASFHVNSEPKAERIPSLTAARGIAPSSTPCGQIYLQKNGSPIPTSFTISAGSNTTANNSTAYFKYVNGFSFSVDSFLHGILCT